MRTSPACGDGSRPVAGRPGGALVLALALGAVALTGCGQSEDRDQVRRVTQRFDAAVQARDGLAACAALSSDTASELVRQEAKPCRRAVLELKLRPGPIARTFVYITSAKVDLAGGDDVFLDRTARGWRLAAVGCRAQEGKPRSRPLQCEVES